MSDHLKPIVEALIFASPEPVTMKTLVQAARHRAEGGRRRGARRAVHADYDRPGGLQIVEVAGGYQIVTRARAARVGAPAVPRADDAEAVGAVARDAGGHRLQAAGHGAGDRRDPRRDSSGGVLGTLVERKLVKIVGRKQVVGRPFLYATTREFLERFGLNDLRDLPKVEDMSDAARLRAAERPARADRRPPTALPFEEADGAGRSPLTASEGRSSSSVDSAK